MHYYLSDWAGDRQGFRPALDAAGWSAIDLRPDPGRREGLCLVGCDERPDRDGGAQYLGDDAGERLPERTRGRFANRLGVGLGQTRFRHAVAELLLEHARTDGTRWRPLRPSLRGFEIHLRGLLWRVPAGGAAYAEPFTGSDNTALASATVTQTWTDVIAGWGVSSNQGYLSSSGDPASYARAAATSATSDNFAQFTLITKTDNGVIDFSHAGPCVRFASGANTSYMAVRGTFSADDFNIRKTVAGTRTTLAFFTTTLALPETVRTDAAGSTIQGVLNGVPRVSVTDTSIPTGTQGGIYGYRPSPSESVVIDDWAFGDLIKGTQPRVGPSGAAGFAAASR